MSAVITLPPKRNRRWGWRGNYRTRLTSGQWVEAADYEALARQVTFAARDAAYRRALGLDDDEQLPNAIGQTIHSRAPLRAKSMRG